MTKAPIVPRVKDLPGRPCAPQWYIDAMVAHERVERVRKHADIKKAWPRWKRFLHWALISWNCDCCLEQRRKGLFR